MFISYFKDILENLPLLGKVFSAVTGFILAFFGLKIQLDKRDFEKQKLIKEKKVEGDRQLFKELKEVFSISMSHIQNHKQSSHFPEKKVEGQTPYRKQNLKIAFFLSTRDLKHLSISHPKAQPLRTHLERTIPLTHKLNQSP